MKQKIVLAMAAMLAVAGTVAQAAPLTAAQKAKGQQITRELTAVLRQKVKTYHGGQFQLKIVPAQRADMGYFSEVYIYAKPARIKDLKFSELTMRARNVRISPTALSRDESIVTLASQTTMRAVITQDEVTEVLSKGRDSADKQLKVSFVGGKIKVTGKWAMSWFSGPMEAVGQLRLGASHTVLADIQSLKLNGKEVPPGLKNKFSEKINPLVDYTDLPFRPPFKVMRFSGNKAIITA